MEICFCQIVRNIAGLLTIVQVSYRRFCIVKGVLLLESTRQALRQPHLIADHGAHRRNLPGPSKSTGIFGPRKCPLKRPKSVRSFLIGGGGLSNIIIFLTFLPGFYLIVSENFPNLNMG